jgi:hypothetical protein
MGDRRDIPDHIDPKTRRLERPNGGFPTRSRPRHIHVNLSHSAFHCLLCRNLSSPGSRKWRTLPRPFEALVPRAGPHNRVAPHIRDGHNGIIERGLNVRDSALNNFLFPFFSLFHTNAPFT